MITHPAMKTTEQADNGRRRSRLIRRGLQRKNGIILAFGQANGRSSLPGLLPSNFGFGIHAFSKVHEFGKFVVFLASTSGSFTAVSAPANFLKSGACH